MSDLSLSCLLMLLTLQATTVYCQDGSHGHTQYVDDHEINEMKEEFDNKTAELEVKILALEAKENYQQYLFLSFLQRLHSISSEYLIDHIGKTHYPARSCNDVKKVVPNAPSGQYWIKNPMGHVSQQYCDMEREACGTRGGWMRVAHLDMTQPDHSCPPGFRTINSPRRLCGRPGPPGCVSVKFPTYNIPYNKVCGKVIAYQENIPDAQCTYSHGDTLEDVYIDGVSITHGAPGNRNHIWSFIATHGETFTDCRGCPCHHGFNGTNVPFIENNFFCDSGIETFNGRRLYHEDPLWDGQGCGSTSDCCTFNNPPWFCTELDQSKSDEIELRLCGDENTDDEDVPIEHIELYIQ